MLRGPHPDSSVLFTNDKQPELMLSEFESVLQRTASGEAKPMTVPRPRDWN